jgi:hypothetical protein
MYQAAAMRPDHSDRLDNATRKYGVSSIACSPADSVGSSNG